MTGHIRIVNDPVELVPLLLTFNVTSFKRVYDLLSRSWMTEEEIIAQVGNEEGIADCLMILRKGNLVEEQWRMPEPGVRPVREYRATYSKFRANFQCNFTDLADLLYIAVSNDETLRGFADRIEEEIRAGNTSINDIARKYGVSGVFVRGVAKRIPHLDVKGQGLVLLDRTR